MASGSSSDTPVSGWTTCACRADSVSYEAGAQMHFVERLDQLSLQSVEAVLSSLRAHADGTARCIASSDEPRPAHVDISESVGEGEACTPGTTSLLHVRMCVLAFEVLASLFLCYGDSVVLQAVAEYSERQSQARNAAGIAGANAGLLSLTSTNCVPVALGIRAMLGQQMQPVASEHSPKRKPGQPARSDKGGNGDVAGSTGEDDAGACARPLHERMPMCSLSVLTDSPLQPAFHFSRVTGAAGRHTAQASLVSGLNPFSLSAPRPDRRADAIRRRQKAELKLRKRSRESRVRSLISGRVVAGTAAGATQASRSPRNRDHGTRSVSPRPSSVGLPRPRPTDSCRRASRGAVATARSSATSGNTLASVSPQSAILGAGGHGHHHIPKPERKTSPRSSPRPSPPRPRVPE